VNPAALIDPVPLGYNHTVSAAGEVVHIAGQWGTGDFAQQVEQSFANLGEALESAGLGFEHVVRIGTYIVDHDEAKLPIVGTALERTWGERLPAQTLIGVQRLALPGMEFEIDAVAVRP